MSSNRGSFVPRLRAFQERAGTLLDADRPLKVELLDRTQAMREGWLPAE
jgi:hypothetical protein